MGELSFLIAMAVLFLHTATKEGMLLNFLVAPLWSLSDFIKKPLFECPVCMIPWWGSILLTGYCIRHGEWIHPFTWFLILAAAGGINSIASSMMEHEQRGNAQTPE